MKIGGNHDNFKAFTDGLAYKNLHDFDGTPPNRDFIDRVETKEHSRKNLRSGSLLLGNILGAIMVLPLVVFAFRGLCHITKAGLDRFLGFCRSFRSTHGTSGQGDSGPADNPVQGIKFQTFAEQLLPNNKFQYAGTEILCNSSGDCPLIKADAYMVGPTAGNGEQLHALACFSGEKPKETRTTTLNHLTVSPKSSLGGGCGVKYLLTMATPSMEFKKNSDSETAYRAACNEALSKLNMGEIESLVFSNFDGATFGLTDNEQAAEIFMTVLKQHLQSASLMADTPKLKSIVINHQDEQFINVCRIMLGDTTIRQ